MKTRRRGGQPPRAVPVRQNAMRQLLPAAPPVPPTGEAAVNQRVADAAVGLMGLAQQYGLQAPGLQEVIDRRGAPAPANRQESQSPPAVVPPGLRTNPLAAAAAVPAPVVAAIPPRPPPPRAAKFLAKGSYGCAYRPPLVCDGETTVEPDSVTKLLAPDSAAEELRFKAMLEPIDPTQQYFLYPKRSCDKTVTQDPEIQKCTPVLQYRKAKLLTMPDGGIELTDVTPQTHPIGATLLAAYNLLKGLQVLHQAGYAHMDIKPGNVVLKGTKARFIDFGLSRKLNDSSVVGQSIWDFTYPWWPYELKLLAGKRPPFRWDEFRYKSVLYEAESRDLFQWYANDGRTFPDPIVNQALGAAYIRFARDPYNVAPEILKGTDVYALGRTLEQLYFKLTGHSITRMKLVPGGEIAHTLPNKTPVKPELLDIARGSQTYGSINEHTKQKRIAAFSRRWLTWCEKMMDPDPAKRMKLDDAIAQFDSELRPLISTTFTGGRRTRRKNSRRKDKWTRSSRVYSS